jgi:hypothetical protein
MSHLAASEVARNVCQALDMLRRPANGFGRDFLLAAGHDPQGDLVMLSNPVALAHASTAEITRSQAPPQEDPPVANQGSVTDLAENRDASAHQLSVPGVVRVAYTMIPSMYVGALTCGVSIQRIECPISMGSRTTYSMGRFLRDERTGETLIAVRVERRNVCHPCRVLPQLTVWIARL